MHRNHKLSPKNQPDIMEGNRCWLYRRKKIQTRHKVIILLKDEIAPICLKNTPRGQSRETQGRCVSGRVLISISTAVSA